MEHDNSSATAVLDGPAADTAPNEDAVWADVATVCRETGAWPMSATVRPASRTVEAFMPDRDGWQAWLDALGGTKTMKSRTDRELGIRVREATCKRNGWSYVLVLVGQVNTPLPE